MLFLTRNIFELELCDIRMELNFFALYISRRPFLKNLILI